MHTSIPRRPLPDDLIGEPPRIRVEFRAACAACAWEGEGHASSLTALEDFDRHVAGAAHRGQLALALVEARDPDLAYCDLCGEPEDHEWGPIEYDWNGETGNHLSCEARNGRA